MENLLICLNAVLPIFLMLAVGYGARCAGVLDRADVARINKIAFKVFVPAMVFYNVYSSDLSSLMRLDLVLYASVGVIAEFFISLAAALLFVKEQNRRGVVIQGLYRSNFVIIGLPFAASLVGGDLGPVALLLAVVIPIFNVLAVVALELFNGQKPNALHIFIDILKNPLIIGTAAGLAALLLGIRLPGPLESVVSDLAKVSSPLLLFLLGAFFRFDKLKEGGKALAWVCLGRLVIFPAIFMGIAAWLGFRSLDFVALLSVFGSSTAITSFTMAQQMGGDADLAGNIVVTTSALCSFTLFFWSLLFKTLGLF